MLQHIKIATRLNHLVELITALILCSAISGSAWSSESACYGTANDGRLEGGVQIPESGANYFPYSPALVFLGRTYLHSVVARTITDSYKALVESAPTKLFVYGEFGWEKGGRMRPHRTHQNGTAVDFMVPVQTSSGQSVLLPTGILNKFGYAIEFDNTSKYEGLTIDFEAMAQHLYELYRAAKANGIGIARVIFEKAFIPKLYTTRRGDYIRKNIPFMKGEPWIRHDEHYHVDFAVQCKTK